MSQLLTLDPLYPEMEEATIGCWLVSQGEVVTAGQPLAELITDKVAYEYQSPGAGTMLAVLSAEKSVVPVGTVLAVLGAVGEPVENLKALEAENHRLAAVRETQLAALQQVTATEASPVAAPARQAVRATPAARRLARERGIDLATIQGSGPDGMITADDL